MKKEVSITFQTITPLWTGDAWQENNEIRPSSLMGGLRYWFAFYCEVEKHCKTENLNVIGIPDESLSKLERPKEGKTLKILLRKYLKECESFDEAVDKALDELGLSIPSRIFGCTGWKSRIRLIIRNEDLLQEELNFEDIEFSFPLNRISKNLDSKFWIRKVLFDNNINEPLKLFKNIKTALITTEYWWEKYLRGFFEYFQDKLIIIGGKNSFGFGFINLSLNETTMNTNNFSSMEDKLVIEKITNLPYFKNKEVLGFNFKYFLRKKESDRDFKKEIFGKIGKASRLYVSNLLKNDNGYVYLVLINNPFSANSSKDIKDEEVLNRLESYTSKLANIK